MFFILNFTRSSIGATALASPELRKALGGDKVTGGDQAVRGPATAGEQVRARRTRCFACCRPRPVQTPWQRLLPRPPGPQRHSAPCGSPERREEPSQPRAGAQPEGGDCPAARRTEPGAEPAAGWRKVARTRLEEGPQEGTAAAGSPEGGCAQGHTAQICHSVAWSREGQVPSREGGGAVDRGVLFRSALRGQHRWATGREEGAACDLPLTPERSRQ